MLPMLLALVLLSGLVLPACGQANHGSSAQLAPEALQTSAGASSNGSATGLLVPHRLSGTAYITVSAVGAAMLLIITALAAWQIRKMRRQERERQRLAEQRELELQQQLAEQEKKANELREVFIPPVILHPDCSVHLGLGSSSEQYCTGDSSLPACQEQGGASPAAAAAGEAHPSRAIHGLILLVRGYQSAFSRISLDGPSTGPWPLPPAAPSKAAPAADLQAGGLTQEGMVPAPAAPSAPSAEAALPAAAEAASRSGREEAAAQQAPAVVEEAAQAEAAQQRAQLEREFLAAEGAADVAAEARLVLPAPAAAEGGRAAGPGGELAPQLPPQQHSQQHSEAEASPSGAASRD